MKLFQTHLVVFLLEIDYQMFVIIQNLHTSVSIIKH